MRSIPLNIAILAEMCKRRKTRKHWRLVIRVSRRLEPNIRKGTRNVMLKRIEGRRIDREGHNKIMVGQETSQRLNC